jgi:H+-translocating NAD(P) transhydrogenase subunit beta
MTCWWRWKRSIPTFENTDLVLMVGACDVVNPAAIEIEGTPISGMPILMAHQAKKVVCCNFDAQPGYSGVANTRCMKRATRMLLAGDAKTDGQAVCCNRLTEGCRPGVRAIAGANAMSMQRPIRLLSSAGSVVIIPGYGMALGQSAVRTGGTGSLLDFESGVRVNYAIHPVAGRMPGHMNVLLAEADVEYDRSA